MTTTTKEFIDKIMKDMYEAEYDDYIRIGVKEILEKYLQELPQQEVECKGNIEKRFNNCNCGNSLCFGVDNYCYNCGAKIKRID